MISRLPIKDAWKFQLQSHMLNNKFVVRTYIKKKKKYTKMANMKFILCLSVLIISAVKGKVNVFAFIML